MLDLNSGVSAGYTIQEPAIAAKPRNGARLAKILPQRTNIGPLCRRLTSPVVCVLVVKFVQIGNDLGAIVQRVNKIVLVLV